MIGATWELVGLSLQTHVRHHLETSRKEGSRNFKEEWGQEQRLLVLTNSIF